MQVRPLNDRERDSGYRNCVTFDEQTKQVVLMVSAAAPVRESWVLGVPP
jgi:hypothetical protein